MASNSKKFVFSLAVGFLLVMVLAAIPDMAAGQQDQVAPPAAKETVTAQPKISTAGNLLAAYIGTLEKKAASLSGPWAQKKAFGNISWFTIVFCSLIMALVIILERLLLWLIRKKAASDQAQPDDFSLVGYFLEALSRPFSVLFFTYGIYVSLAPLFGYFTFQNGLNPFQASCNFAVRLITFIVAIWFLVRLVALVDLHLKRWARKTDGKMNEILVPLVGKTLRVFILILGGVVLVQNMTGVKIGPLLASLGIGGIAIALAAKDSIANLFGTLTIVFDKPFQPGERILIDGHDGTVESVGFRSTRIRTLTGHLLTIPNEKVTNSSIENIGRRPNIRWLTNIGITYDTPPEKVARAVTIIKEILTNHEGMHEDLPPRVYFNNFNDWSLNILVVAWYHPPDYWAYLDWVQKTALEIMQRFSEAGISFAFPSRTIYMAGDPSAPGRPPWSTDPHV